MLDQEPTKSPLYYSSLDKVLVTESVSESVRTLLVQTLSDLLLVRLSVHESVHESDGLWAVWAAAATVYSAHH